MGCRSCHCRNIPNASMVFNVQLNGNKEVPMNDSEAGGIMYCLLSKDQTRLDFVLHTFNWAEGTVITMAHFHAAPVGTNGPVVKTIPIDGSIGVALGTWTTDDAEPLTPELIDQLNNKGLYVNVHTEAHPGGEIRGQVRKSCC